MSLRYDTVRFGILQLSYDRKRIRPSEIATLLDVNPSSVTRRVQELKDDGLVRVASDPHDGRSLFVEITARGKAEMQRYLAAGVRDLAAVVRDWNASDIRLLTSLLARLVETWEYGTELPKRTKKLR
ncbi:MAG: MarR family winged helix-turn-helix transcriptional regulator [Vulcanimicrobiaceae bacterium]